MILRGGVKPISAGQQLYRDIVGDSFHPSFHPTFNGRNFIKLRITDINNKDIMHELLTKDYPEVESWKKDKQYDYIIFSKAKSFIFLIKRTMGGEYGHGSVPWTAVSLQETKYTEEQMSRVDGLYREDDSVLYAGEISFYDHGKLHYWNNQSGHFQPASLDEDTNVREILNEIGMDLNKYRGTLSIPP